MTDIVERLRNSGFIGGYDQEAADEIERLRALVDAGDDLYACLVDEPALSRYQKDSLATYAKLSNAYRAGP